MVWKGEIVWVRQDSVTYKLNVGKNEKGEDDLRFCKSFNPRDITAAYHLFFGEEKLSFRPNPLHYDSQRSLYNRELHLLKALAGTGEDFVPVIVGEDAEKLHLFMEYIPFPTYQDFLKHTNAEEDQKASVRQMVDFLLRMHNYCSADLQKIIKAANAERERLRLKSVEEESTRLERHLEIIVSSYDPEMLRLASSTSDPKRLRKQIAPYLIEKGINLAAIATEFIHRDREITGGKEEFVHGDFRPQNIFYETKEDGQRQGIKICDFDTVRLGTSNDDLVTALYNIHTYPFREDQEQFFTQLAEHYFKERKMPAAEVPTRLASVVASSLKASLRDFGVHCSMAWPEMNWFLNDTEKRRYEQSSSPKETLLQEKFIAHFEPFFDYYLAGDGGRMIRAAGSPSRELIQKQLLAIENLFRRCGILNHHSNPQFQRKKATG